MGITILISLYFIIMLSVGVIYSLLRRKLKDHALLPHNIARCSIRKLNEEMNYMEEEGISTPYTSYITIMKKLYVIYWVTVIGGPLIIFASIVIGFSSK